MTKKRSRTSTIVPGFAAAGLGPTIFPAVTEISAALSAFFVREVSLSFATEPIEGRASPLNPRKQILCTSSVIFEVQWRETARVN